MTVPIHALGSSSKGKIVKLENFRFVARTGDLYREPAREELIPLPETTQTVFLPDRHAIALNQATGKFEVLKEEQESAFIHPAAAILPIGYLRTLLPASAPAHGKKNLPQWAYTAVGIKNDRWMCAAHPIETKDNLWDNKFYNTPDLQNSIQKKLTENPKNRVLTQLAKCAGEYHCCTAQNIFYERWEGALPVSPACNAECVGCISLQPEGLAPSSHQRIKFSPTIEEIVQVAIPHLENSPDAILSFGQGCEGEPLLASPTIEKALSAIRSQTQKGTLNMNTNASRPKAFHELCKAGLDTVRISMNSAHPETYASYYQPKGYTFEEVEKTARIAREEGLGVSINLLTFPGVTDREEEVEALLGFIDRTEISAIQWRNLAIDPDQYLAAVPKRHGNILGITTLLEELKKEFPKLKHLSFSRPKEFFKCRGEY